MQSVKRTANFILMHIAALLCLAAAGLFALPCSDVPVLAASGSQPVYIGSPRDFAEFAARARSQSYSKGVTFILSADIDLTGYQDISVPYMDGTFEGHGHVISGFVSEEDISDFGLFRYVGENGSIRSLILEGDVVSGADQRHTGLLCGTNAGEITDCTVRGSLNAQSQVGAVAGYNAPSGIIRNCTNEASVDGKYQTGGIAGQSEGTIRNCLNLGGINLNTRIKKNEGNSDGDAVNISIPNAVTGLAADERANETGGIVGSISGRISYCENRGAVGFSELGSSTGGIAGRCSGNMLGCANHGIVRGRKNVGGAVGALDPAKAVELDRDYHREIGDDLDELQSAMESLAASGRKLGDDLSHNFDDVTDRMKKLRDSVRSYLDGYDYDLRSHRDQIHSHLTEAEEVIRGMDYNFRLKRIKNCSKNLRDDIEAIEDILASLQERLPLPDQESIAALQSLYEKYTSLLEKLKSLLAKLEEIEERIKEGLEEGLGDIISGNMIPGGLIPGYEEEAGGEAWGGDDEEEPTGEEEAWEEAASQEDLQGETYEEFPEQEQDEQGGLPAESVETVPDTSPESSTDTDGSSGENSSGSDDAGNDGRDGGGSGDGREPSQTGADSSQTGAQRDETGDGEDQQQDRPVGYGETEPSPSDGITELMDMLIWLQGYQSDAIYQAGRIFDCLEKWPSQIKKIERDMEDVEEESREIHRISDSLLDSMEARTDTMRSDLRLQGDELTDSSDNLSDTLTEDYNRVADDIDALVGSFDSIRNTIRSGSDDLRDAIEERSLYVDVSEDDTSAEGDGKIISCSNDGEIYASQTGGGIVGCVDIEEVRDRSVDIFERIRYLDQDDDEDDEESGEKDSIIRHVNALIYGCVNEGDVTADSGYSGGIAGKARYGVIARCAGFCDVSTGDGRWAGGIAGLSRLTIRDCDFYGGVTGSAFVGGVAGRGENISGTRSCVYLDEETQLFRSAGAVAGKAMGTLRGNLFVDNGIGAVDGITKLEEATALTYEEMCSQNGIPRQFCSFTVRFMDGDTQLGMGEYSYGEELPVSAYPQVSGNEGEYVYWEDKGISRVVKNVTIHTVRRVYIPSLASAKAAEEEVSLMLLGGQFYPDSTLYAIEIHGDEVGRIEEIKQELLPGNRNVISRICRYRIGQEEELNPKMDVRVLSGLIPANRIFILDDDLNLRGEVMEAEQVGRYCSVKTGMESSGYVVTVVYVTDRTLFIVILSLIAIIALTVISIAVIKRRRKQKRQRAAAAGEGEAADEEAGAAGEGEAADEEAGAAGEGEAADEEAGAAVEADTAGEVDDASGDMDGQ